MLRPGQGPDVVALLTLKHRRIEALLLKAEQGEEGERQRTLQHALDELALHMTVEENAFYPTLRGWASGSLPSWADKVLHSEAHESCRAAMAALRGPEATRAPDFVSACRRLRELVVGHHRAEETLVFRQLAQAMTAIEREALGDYVARREDRLRGMAGLGKVCSLARLAGDTPETRA